MPELPKAWLRPSGEPERPADFEVLAHNIRQMGAIAAAREAQARAGAAAPRTPHRKL
jgi:hypothetical protein